MLVSRELHNPVNGSSQPPSGPSDVVEYEKILNLRDQIFAGTHPRLKLPDQIIRKVTPRSAQTPLPAPQASTFDSVTSSQHKESPLPPATQAAISPNVSGASPSSGGGRVPALKSTTSELDPIFLTKSDDLIRAEIQLQRQRIERVLRDQLEAKKLEARQKPLPQESNPDFDVAEVFAQALELVKPPTATDAERANGTVAASDSFDENSFYSSRAPDSPQHEHRDVSTDISPQETQMVDINDGDITVIEHPTNHNTGETSFTGQDMLNSQDQAPVFNQHANTYGAPRGAEDTRMRDASIGRRQLSQEPYDEPEYSPPGPDIPMGGRRDTGPHISEAFPNLPGRPGRRQSYVDQGRRPRSPPSRDIRVVRNHITSPAAPQPSRVSPLAVSKVPSLPQSRARRGTQAGQAPTGHDSERTSPEGPAQPPISRKRRRVQDGRNKRRHVEEERPAESPDIPYIKPEPVSPPPFTDPPVQYLARRRPAPEQYTLIDDDSPQYVPVDNRREVGGRGGIYEEGYGKAYNIDNPIDLSVSRASSRVGYRRPVREEHDLRRVASLQHIRQPEYTHDYPEQVADVSPRLVRAASYVERPVQVAKPRYYEEPPESPYQRRYVSRPVSPPPPPPPQPAQPRYRDSYPDIQPEPHAMPPPQRRVVVDADGNRYYESIVNPRMAPPPPPPQFSKPDPYEEGGVLAPRGRVRAMSIVDDPYRERRYVEEMPPPEMAYRRSGRVARAPPSQSQLYEHEIDERAPPMRSGSVQVVEYPPRQATYAEDVPPYRREEIVRVASVRPPTSRYEEPLEQRGRVQSVRPMRRDVSVYIDDEPRQTREYAPMEPPGYNPSRSLREEHFYDPDDVGRMEPESGPNMVRRVSRRF